MKVLLMNDYEKSMCNIKKIRKTEKFIFIPLKSILRKLWRKTLIVAAYDYFFKISFENYFFKKKFINRLNKKCVWMKPWIWRTQFTSFSLIDIRNITHFFIFIFKIVNIAANNLMLFQYFCNLQNYTNFVIFHWKILLFTQHYT